MPKAKKDKEGDNHVLTDEDRATLLLHHKKAYLAAEAEKKAAAKEFTNVKKLAQAEIGDNAIQMIKDAIELETVEGEARLKQRVEDLERVARWMAVPMFAQTDMFSNPDLTPATEQAFNEGKRDGKTGDPKENPYSKGVPQHDSYEEGWAQGQKDLFAIQRKRDEGFFSDAATEEAEDEGELEGADTEEEDTDTDED